jgi:hypothetical protein
MIKIDGSVGEGGGASAARLHSAFSLDRRVRCNEEREGQPGKPWTATSTYDGDASLSGGSKREGGRAQPWLV